MQLCLLEQNSYSECRSVGVKKMRKLFLYEHVSMLESKGVVERSDFKYLVPLIDCLN